MTEPLLDLDTLIVRPTIDIDGTRYDILSPDELSVLDNRRFSRWQEELHRLHQADEDSPELEALVDTITRKVLAGVPAAVIDALSGTQKVAVVEVFIGLLLRNRAGTAGAIARAMGNQQIGALFSPLSPGSTAAPRASGWRKRLWPWSRRI